MPLFSNTDQVVARYAAHIQEFRKLYEFHSLRSGSPQDFVQLAPKLASSEGFRLDFSDRVRRVRDGERGGLSAGEMLTIVGVAIGGAGIGGAELELYESAGTVQVMLAGVGGWREPGAAGVGAADGMGAGDAGAGETFEIAEAARQDRDGVEDRGRRGAHDSGDSRDSKGSHAGGGERNGGAGGEVSPEMKETLARLEMASLQLKVYLDDIDRRMGRIEPHLDDLTAMVQTSSEHFQKLERGTREPHPGASGEREIADEAVRPRRLRADEAIAAAMERASQEKVDGKAETVGLRAGKGEGEESVAAGADEAIGLKAPAAMSSGSSAEEEWRVEPKGRPIGWGRRNEIAAEPAAAEASQAAAEIGSEEKAGAGLEDGAAMGVVAGGGEAALVPLELQPAAVPKSGIGVRRRAAWGAAAAVFLISAASLAYVYQPWHFRAGQAPAEIAAVPAGADGGTEAGQGEASGAPAGEAGVPRNGAAVLNTSAQIAGRASANRKRGESAVREPSGTEAQKTQADGAASLTKAGGGGSAGAAPVSRASTNVPGAAAAATTDADGAQPPKDRVEGARAADVSRAPRVENLHPETTAERAATGGGPAAQDETAAMVSKVSAPSGFGPSAAPTATGDVPRSSAGRTEIAPPTIAVALISAPSATYPQQARQLGVEGQVVIQATVNKSGTVTSTRVMGGPFLLRQSAQDAVMRRRYKPYLLHGDPTEFQTMVTLNYKLSK